MSLKIIRYPLISVQKESFLGKALIIHRYCRAIAYVGFPHITTKFNINPSNRHTIAIRRPY